MKHFGFLSIRFFKIGLGLFDIYYEKNQWWISFFTLFLADDKEFSLLYIEYVNNEWKYDFLFTVSLLHFIKDKMEERK